jgi:ribosome-associated protein
MSKHYRPADKVRWQDHILPGRTKAASGGDKSRPGKTSTPGKPGKSGKPDRQRSREGDDRQRGNSGHPVRGGQRSSGPAAAHGHALPHPIRRGGDAPRFAGAKPARVTAKKSPGHAQAISDGQAPKTPRAPRLDGQGLPFITLSQFLKHLNVVGSGGEAKSVIRTGALQVNGEVEARPGRKLHQGDAVLFAGAIHAVEIKP